MARAMSGLFTVHSVLRFFVIFAGVGALSLAVGVLLGKQTLERPFRIFTSSYLGLLHLQVLIGLAVVMVRPWFPSFIGHIVMMVVAAAAGQVLVSVGKRKTPPNARLMLLGLVVSLACVAGGVFAIGRHPFQVTAF